MTYSQYAYAKLFVMVEGILYSVPYEYIKKKVDVILTSE